MYNFPGLILLIHSKIRSAGLCQNAICFKFKMVHELMKSKSAQVLHYGMSIKMFKTFPTVKHDMGWEGETLSHQV